MGKPTLLVAGNLRGAAGRASPDAVPVEYIIGLVRREMPEFGGPAPAAFANRVFIVRSKTGSGKSTVLPAYLFRLLRSEKTDKAVKLAGPGVICTQPRILTAQTLARDQGADGAYPDLVLGVTVGYQTGPLNEKPASGLIYATAGTLLAQLRTMPDADIMARYRFIVVDEAHERSLDIDALLMRLKAFLRRNLGNPRLPFVILASATLPLAKYWRYFELGGDPDDSANVVEVEGRAFSVEVRWPRVGTNDYPREAARTALEIHEQNPDDPPAEADILVFVPGKAEIRGVVDALAAANLKFRAPGSATPPFLVLAIDSEVVAAGGRDYRLLKEDPGRLAVPSKDGKTFLRPSRRIVVSTVVAETGLTIETLKYVVDCGWSRVQEVYYPGRYRGIVTRPAPRSRIEQRKGRAGRRFPGVFYPLYTKGVFDALGEEQLPEAVLEGVGPIFLDIATAAAAAAAAAGRFRVENIDMLDAPPVDALAAALEEAVVFGYLRFAPGGPAAPAGHVLTRLGAAAARLSYLQMHHAQTLFAGYLWRVSLRDLALVVALYDQRDALIYQKSSPGPNQAADDEQARRRALRAGLPTHLIGGADAAADDARARGLIADDFLEALLAFEGFVRALDHAQGDLPRLLDWCDANGVSFDGAVFLAALRDGVMSDMLAAGLNPFWGDTYRLADAAPEAFPDTVVRLKNCIYAGLRFFLLDRDDRTGLYRTAGGETVEIAAAARRLVTNTVRLRNAKKDSRDKYPPFLYRLQPGLVSVLDGYVDVDGGAGDPRRGGAENGNRV